MKQIVKVSTKYGAIAGVLGFVLVIILYYINRHPFLIPVYFDFRIILFGVFVFFTLKELRDYHFGGILYFPQGVIASFLFVATFAIVASIAIGVFATAENQFLSDYITLTIEQIKTLPKDVIDRIGKDAYESNLKQLPSTNAYDLAKLYFWQSFMIGLFISIILSVVLRRQPKN